MIAFPTSIAMTRQLPTPPAPRRSKNLCPLDLLDRRLKEADDKADEYEARLDRAEEIACQISSTPLLSKGG